MPILGNIEWKTDIKTFLKEDEISDLVDSMNDKGLKEIESSFATPITNEMKAGLSLEALNIDGRAPLNELSLELSKKIQNSITDMEAIKMTAQGEGNKHRQDEANEYYEKVIEEYNERLKLVEEAKNKYQEKRNYYVKDIRIVSDGNGGTKEIEYNKEKTYDDCIIIIHINGKEYGNVELKSIEESDPNDIDPGVEVHNALVEAVRVAVDDANKFYSEYVEKAKILKNECDNLNTSTGTPSVSTTGDQPYGVQENAKHSNHYDYKENGTRDVYTNPDGSTVTVDKDDKGNIVFERLEDKNGNVTETIWYDENGNEKEKYEFNIEEESEGVYKSTPTHYIQGEKDEDYDTAKGTTYYWYDKDGNKHAGSEAPDASEVAQHYKNSNGSTRDVYTNPDDGSTVTVDKDANGNKKFQRTQDKNGNVTETIWYDEDGNEKEKYEFNIEEESEGVYKSTPTHYVQDENDKTQLVEDTEYAKEHGPTYNWYDKEGNYHEGSKAPDSSEVGYTTEKTNPTEESTAKTASTESFYNYNDFTTSVKNNNDIELPPGYTLKYDGNISDNYSAEAPSAYNNYKLESTTDNPLTLKHEDNGYYQVYDKEGPTGKWLDPDRMIGGSNSGTTTIGNDTTLLYDRNGDGKADEYSYANDPAKENQSGGIEESGGE